MVTTGDKTITIRDKYNGGAIPVEEASEAEEITSELIMHTDAAEDAATVETTEREIIITEETITTTIIIIEAGEIIIVITREIVMETLVVTTPVLRKQPEYR